MNTITNEHGQPIGSPLPDWKAPPRPPYETLSGRFCRLEQLDPTRHATDLYAANSRDDGRMWTYLAYGPFNDLGEYQAWMERICRSDDPLFYAIIDQQSAQAVGVASYLRIDPTAGSIEVGHLAFSPLLQQTAAATEAMYLMMRHAFELGYRRYEWKCDSLNAPSRAAAERLGFVFEGVFRQATIYKGRNRDTAWYSIIDGEWPHLKTMFETWLAADNFDEHGRQRRSLNPTYRAPQTSG